MEITLAIQVSLPGISLYLVSVYIPPLTEFYYQVDLVQGQSLSISSILWDLCSLLQDIPYTSKAVVLMGNLNATVGMLTSTHK